MGQGQMTIRNSTNRRLFATLAQTPTSVRYWGQIAPGQTQDKWQPNVHFDKGIYVLRVVDIDTLPGEFQEPTFWGEAKKSTKFGVTKVLTNPRNFTKWLKTGQSDFGNNEAAAPNKDDPVSENEVCEALLHGVSIGGDSSVFEVTEPEKGKIVITQITDPSALAQAKTGSDISSSWVQCDSDPATDGLPRAGDTPLLALFTEGAIVLLQSRSSGKNVIITNGEVEGLGKQGVYAQFRVHVRRPRIVALENVAIPEKYLTISEGETTIGREGNFSDLLLKEVGDGYLCLESLEYPGQHVGILSSGDVKPPAETSTEYEGQFKPILHTRSPLTQPPAAQAESKLAEEESKPAGEESKPAGEESQTEQPPYPPTTEEEAPYPPSTQEQPPYPPTTEEQAPYPPSTQEQPPYPPTTEEQAPYPPSSQEQPPFPPTTEEQAPYPPSAEQQPPFPPTTEEQAPYPPSTQEQPPFPPTTEEQAPYPPSTQEQPPFPPTTEEQAPYPPSAEQQPPPQIPYPDQPPYPQPEPQYPSAAPSETPAQLPYPDQPMHPHPHLQHPPSLQSQLSSDQPPVVPVPQPFPNENGVKDEVPMNSLGYGFLPEITAPNDNKEETDAPQPKPSPVLPSRGRKGTALHRTDVTELVDYTREPVESNAKFPEKDIRKIVQHVGLHANNKYLLFNCVDKRAVKKNYLSLKPGRRLFKPQIRPQEEGTPWELVSTSDGKHFTLRSKDESGNIWYFAVSPKCAPDKDPKQAGMFGFEAVPDGDKDEFKVYHRHPKRDQKFYLILSPNGKDIVLSESDEASRWRVVPHDPKSGSHGVECHLYINSFERNDPIFCQDTEGSQTKITKEVQYSTGFDKSVETSDFCGWEKSKESTHSVGVGASIGAAFNLFSVAFSGNYQYSKTTRKSEFQEKETVKGLLKQESMQETTTYEIAPGEEIFQKVLVVELFRAWSVKETGQPFFIEKTSSLDNRTATIVIRKKE